MKKLFETSASLALLVTCTLLSKLGSIQAYLTVRETEYRRIKQMVTLYGEVQKAQPVMEMSDCSLW